MITLKPFTDEKLKAKYLAICKKHGWIEQTCTTIDEPPYISIYYRIYKDDTPIGYITIQKRFVDYCICFFYIKEEYRNKGYGTEALEQCLRICWNEEGCRTCYLFVNPQDRRTMHLYQKYGYIFDNRSETEREVTFFLKSKPKLIDILKAR